MAEHILFLTGKLAEPRLHRVLDSMLPVEFTYEVRNIGLSVAALMTAGMICRRVGRVNGVSRVLVPGLCRGDLDEAAGVVGAPVQRGPDDLKDLPAFFGGDLQPVDLSGTDTLIFAEIVEAPHITVDAILDRAARYAADGADVIDLGCLPETPFSHLEEAVEALGARGFRVSVDSLQAEELLRGARAGADFLLSLTENSLWVAEETRATPVLIPEHHGDMDSLFRCIDVMQERGRPFIADPVLDPIHFGFMRSLERYSELRARYPGIDIMMGIGNLTELTGADTTGINALLLGLISELHITSVLTTEVSGHARSAVREVDLARRIMYSARAENSLPKGISPGLMTTHECGPHPYSEEEIRALAGDIRDPSYRIQVSESGIHVYNRDGLETGQDPFELFPRLARLENDAPHAFYMGVELARAQIALMLGKRYVQDRQLNWGVAVPDTDRVPPDSRLQHAEPGSTLSARRKRRKKRTAG